MYAWVHLADTPTILVIKTLVFYLALASEKTLHTCGESLSDVVGPGSCLIAHPWSTCRLSATHKRVCCSERAQS